MSYEKEFSKAHEKYIEKNYAEALVIYDDLFNKANNFSIEIQKEYAKCLQKKLRYAESMKMTKSILKDNPNDKDMLLNYCICLGKQNNHAEALKFYEKILKIDENFKTEIGYYAYLLGRVGNTEKADHFYKTAIKEDADNAWYISHYAVFLQGLKRYDEADKYYKKAIEKDSQNSWLIKRYALFLNETKGKETAYAYYDELIKKNPENCNFYINNAELAFISDDKEIAFKILKKAEKMDNRLNIKIIVLFYLGVYFISQKRDDKLKDLEKSMSQLRQSITKYIDRDLTDLDKYINRYFTESQMNKYKIIFNIMRVGGKDNANNRS